mgnify:CR=1 FL=1
MFNFKTIMGATLASTLLAGGALAADEVTLQLKWVTQAQFAGYYVALEKGFYTEEDLDVTIKPGGPDIAPTQVIAGGGADVVIDWMPSALAAREKGLPLVNIAQPFKSSGMMLTCLKESGVATPEDFPGHTLGVWFYGNEYPFLSWMAHLGIPTEGGTDGVEVNLSQGFAVDGFGDRDTLRNIEDVRGSGQRDKLVGNNAANKLDGQGMNDRLFGLGGDDSLLGGTGWDRLNGGFGNDTLNGGWGNDRLEGRAGADTFVFAGRFGDDVIIGFDAQNDAEKIDLSGVRPIKGMFDLRRNHMEQDGDDVVIDDGNGNTITLRDVELSDLGASDFIF